MNETTIKKLTINKENAHKLVSYLCENNIKLSGNILICLLGSRNMYIDIIENYCEDNSNIIIIESEEVNYYIKYIQFNNKNITYIDIKENDFKDFVQKLNIMPKFDYIIQNPPYSKSLHLKFLETGYNALADNGKMVIIEPSMWLINLQAELKQKPSSSMKKYVFLKKILEKHIYQIKIENYNNEFRTGLYVPFAITYINKSQNFKNIKYSNCGYVTTVNSINDCNLIGGNFNIIKNIFNKLHAYDKLTNHITHENLNNDEIYYSKVLDILGRSFCGDPRWSDVWFINNLYAQPCYWAIFDTRMKIDISKDPHHSLKNGYHYDNPVYTDKIATNLYGTYNELDNLKYNIYHTKLFPFINICINIDQNNNSLSYVPWLVDKKYTDQEIYDKFGFTDEEIKLIEITIKKYERYSPWFKRYMYGPSSVSDEEVQKFIDNLNNA